MVHLMIAAGLVALLVPAYASVLPRHLPGGLDTSDIPAACSNTCQSLVNSVEQGCVDDVTCFCSATFVTSLRPCVQCSYDAVPSQFDGTPEQYIQQYSSTCAAAGLPVDGGATSSGTGASAAGSTTTPSGTSASGSQPAPASTSTMTSSGTGTASKAASSGTSLSAGTTSKSTATTSASGSSGTSASGSGSGDSSSSSSQSGATSTTQNMVGILAAVGVIAAFL